MAAPLAGSCGCQRMLNSSKKLINIHRKLHWSSVAYQQAETNVQAKKHDVSKSKIVIPDRIHRGPTDILKALSDTVGQDPTAPRHKYIDDPFTIPISTTDKKSFTLAKVSGQKAAQHVIKNYPQYFTEDPAEPSIQAYDPKNVMDVKFDHEPDTIEGLNERIAARASVQAYEAFQLIEKDDIPTETFNRLLDLLCVNNGKDPDRLSSAEENFLYRGVDKEPRQLWIDGGPADTVFEAMPEKNVWAYSSIIRGLEKFCRSQRAYNMFCEMKTLGMPVNLETYNAVIKTMLHVHEENQERWQAIKGLLREIKDAGLKPTLATFNDVMSCIAMRSKWTESKDWIMMVINEMREIGIEPSLTSWHLFLWCHYANTDISNNMVLHDVINYLEGTEFTLRSSSDDEFFTTAMKRISKNLKDVDLAYKLVDLLKLGNNGNFIGGGFKEGWFYDTYLSLLCEFEDIDKIMEEYDRITPHMFSPSFQCMKAIINAIDLHAAYQYIPRIWSDLVFSGTSRREQQLDELLKVMSKAKPPPELEDQFCSIVKAICNQAEKESASRYLMQPFRLSGQLIGKMIQVYLNCGRLQEAWELFANYKKEASTTSGYPSVQSLSALGEACLQANEFDKISDVITQMSHLGFNKEADGLSKKYQNKSKVMKNELKKTAEI